MFFFKFKFKSKLILDFYYILQAMSSLRKKYFQKTFFSIVYYKNKPYIIYYNNIEYYY